MSKAGRAASDAARAKEFLASTPRCSVCNGQMISRGRDAHYACDRTTIVGKICTCPNGCSADRWGNGRAACDPTCLPCRLMAGKSIRKQDDS